MCVCLFGIIECCLGWSDQVSWYSLSLCVRYTHRFVAKVRSLDPSYRDVVPWQPRGYRRKRGREGQTTALATEAKGPQVKRLFSPLLEQEEQVSVLILSFLKRCHPHDLLVAQLKKPAPSSTSQEFHFHAEGMHSMWSRLTRLYVCDIIIQSC